MYFLYADESGDIGLMKSPTRYFVLSGLVVHELNWHQTLESILNLRRALKSKYGLKLREELHAAHFMHKPMNLQRIQKSLRLNVLRDVIDYQRQLTNIAIINVVVDKQNKETDSNIFQIAWTTLIQRFHNTILHKNFPGPKNSDDRGILFVDQTDEPQLRRLLRKLRRYNPVTSRYGTLPLAIPTTTMVEDAVHRHSQHSYFIQISDVNAYFLMQKLAPCGYVKKKGGRNYFDRLDPVLCKVANKKDRYGIVFR